LYYANALSEGRILEGIDRASGHVGRRANRQNLVPSGANPFKNPLPELRLSKQDDACHETLPRLSLHLSCRQKLKQNRPLSGRDRDRKADRRVPAAV
jgi:hypothetical protein